MANLVIHQTCYVIASYLTLQPVTFRPSRNGRPQSAIGRLIILTLPYLSTGYILVCYNLPLSLSNCQPRTQGPLKCQEVQSVLSRAYSFKKWLPIQINQSNRTNVLSINQTIRSKGEDGNSTQEEYNC